MRAIRLFRNQSGATAVEYALVAALISITIVAGATMLGDNLDTHYQNVATSVTATQ